MKWFVETMLQFLAGLIGPSLPILLLFWVVVAGGCNTIGNIRTSITVRRAVAKARAETWEKAKRACNDGRMEEEGRFRRWFRIRNEQPPAWFGVLDAVSLKSAEVTVD